MDGAFIQMRVHAHGSAIDERIAHDRMPSRPIHKFAATKLTNWLRESKVLKKGDMIVTASGQYPGVVGTTDTIKVRMLE